MTQPLDLEAEWLEADRLGGFASGTVGGRRTRRYHALLLTAMNPPTGRVVLVNGFDARITTSNGVFAISSQYYEGEVVHPDGEKRLESFQRDPWPTWRFHVEHDTWIEQELFVPKHLPLVVLRWRLPDPRQRASLTVRPFLSGRDYHSLHHQNPSFRTDADVEGERVQWRPYAPLPKVVALSNGRYRH
jgi:predicted glycogen debranching enzyme